MFGTRWKPEPGWPTSLPTENNAQRMGRMGRMGRMEKLALALTALEMFHGGAF